MPLRAPTPLVLLLFAARSDMKHSREVVGTWVRDSLYGGGIVRATDTLRLRAEGSLLCLVHRPARDLRNA